MSVYRAVVAGTDGPQSSPRAVPRAAALAGAGKGADEAAATDVHPVSVAGPPVEARMDLAGREEPDVIAVGTRGPGTLGGRLVGPVPSAGARRSQLDVLAVHTTG